MSDKQREIAETVFERNQQPKLQAKWPLSLTGGRKKEREVSRRSTPRS